VTNAKGRLDENRLSFDDAKDVALGACHCTRAAADAAVRVDYWVERSGLGKSGFFRFGQGPNIT
jgi:hypothetical protein